MQHNVPVGDAVAAAGAWEKYRVEWLADLVKVKQERPAESEIDNLRDIWVEAFIYGRMSNANS